MIRTARRFATSTLFVAGLVVACRDATAVRVHVLTDVPWQGGRRVLIAATSGSTPRTSEPNAEITAPWTQTDLGDLVLLPPGSGEGPIRVTVVMGVSKDARGCSESAPDGCIFARRKLSFVPHRTLTIPVTLYASCIGVPCSDDETCSALGKCVPAGVDPETCTSPEGCFLPGESAPPALRAAEAIDAGKPPVTSDAGTDAAVSSAPLVTVAAGRWTSCALRAGKIKCWGLNDVGQLGVGSTSSRGRKPGEMGAALPSVDLGPGRVPTLLRSQQYHLCAVLSDGHVVCWGNNQAGSLGYGDAVVRGILPGDMGENLPFVDLGPGVLARSVAVGNDSTCALLVGDRLKCWGSFLGGQHGYGDLVTRGDGPGEMGAALPFVDVGAGRTVRSVAKGGSTTCVILDNGGLKCWGQSTWDPVTRGDAPGEMGDALPYVPVGTGRTVTALALQQGPICALLDNGTVKCWGANDDGALGQGDTNVRLLGALGDSLPPIDLGPGRTARAIGTGDEHVCALLDDGHVKCWGNNSNGELGLGDTSNRGDAPGEMGANLPNVDLGTGRTATSIAVGSTHTCAALDDGTVKCWGSNDNGELGLGDARSRGGAPGQMGDALPPVDLGPP